MLRLTLGKFPGIISLPETHFFTFLNQNRGNHFGTEENRRKLATKWMQFHTMKRMELPASPVIEAFAKNGQSWRDLFEITVQQYIEFRKIEVPKDFLVVEKTPAHVFYQKDILDVYPETTLIYLVRDPRDVVASLKTVNWSTSNVYTNAMVWRNAIRNIKQGHRRYVIHYEKLVTHPEESLSTLAGFLNMDFEKEVIFQELDGVPAPKMASSKQSFQPINTKNIGYWKDRLSGIDRDKDLIEKLCGKEMVQFGYQLDGIIKDKRYYRAMIMWKFSHLLTKIFRI